MFASLKRTASSPLKIGQIPKGNKASMFRGEHVTLRVEAFGCYIDSYKHILSSTCFTYI